MDDADDDDFDDSDYVVFVAVVAVVLGIKAPFPGDATTRMLSFAFEGPLFGEVLCVYLRTCHQVYERQYDAR